MNETCGICNGFAGFETSPEGSACGVCDTWVCDDHVDYATMRYVYEVTEGRNEGTDPICVECGQDIRDGKVRVKGMM